MRSFSNPWVEFPLSKLLDKSFYVLPDGRPVQYLKVASQQDPLKYGSHYTQSGNYSDETGVGFDSYQLAKNHRAMRISGLAVDLGTMPTSEQLDTLQDYQVYMGTELKWESRIGGVRREGTDIADLRNLLRRNPVGSASASMLYSIIALVLLSVLSRHT